MAKRGPKPKKRDRLQKRGRGAPIRPGEDVTVLVSEPEYPGWLSEKHRPRWERTVEALRKLRVLSSTDENLIARYTALHVRFEECVESLEVEDDYLTDENGQTMRNPKLAQYEKLADQLLRIEDKLGLSPQARTALAKNPDAKDETQNEKLSLVRKKKDNA